MAAIGRRVTTSHIRLLDTSRDLLSVADLLEEAFQGELDSAGRRAVREMRLMGRWGGLLGRLESLIAPGAEVGPGFVWVEDNQVVGTLSLRRAAPYGPGWLIGNVAVCTAYRRRGIARALMNEALKHIRQRGGNIIRLLVRADNFPAVRLYTKLGFHQTCTLAYWHRPLQVRRAPACERGFCGSLSLLDGVKLRRMRSSDQGTLYDLARAAQPADLEWAEPVRRSDFYVGWDRRLGDWLIGRRRVGIVAESSQGILGVALVNAPRPPEDGQLRVWVTPGYRGKLEAALVSAALGELTAPFAALMCAFPAHEMQMYTVLAQFGFLPRRILTHMRLKL